MNPRGPERPQAVRHHVGVSRLAPYLARRPRHGELYFNFPHPQIGLKIVLIPFSDPSTV